MSSNIIGPLPKKADAPIKKVEKPSGDLYNIEEPLVTTINTVDNEGKPRKNWLRKPTILLFQQGKTDTIDKTEKSE